MYLIKRKNVKVWLWLIFCFFPRAFSSKYLNHTPVSVYISLPHLPSHIAAFFLYVSTIFYLYRYIDIFTCTRVCLIFEGHKYSFHLCLSIKATTRIVFVSMNFIHIITSFFVLVYCLSIFYFLIDSRSFYWPAALLHKINKLFFM